MTNNQQPGPTGVPTPGVPGPGQQPYPPQQYPQAYPGQPYPGQPPATQPIPGQPYGTQPQQPYPGAQPIPGQPYGAQPIPGQPYGAQPQQPYPGQPYAGQPYAAQQPYPGQQPYGPQGPVPPPYGPAGQPPGKPKGKGALILGITGGVAALAVIASFLVPRSPVLPVTPQLPGTTASVPSATASVPGASVTPVTQTDSAQAAVQDYLQAVASGDSASAIASAVSPPMEQSLLTDEMLAANQAVAPITDITVTEGTGSDHQSVQAAYNLGGTPVNTTFEVTRVNGSWKLDAVAVPLPIDLSATVGVDLAINGVQLLNINPAVFPGRYTVEAVSGWYTLSGGAVQVENTTPSGQAPEVKLALTSSGVSAIRKAAQAKLNSCLKKNSLAPAGCGFGSYLPGTNKVRPSTIDWRVVKGGTAMRKLKPSLDAPDSAIAKVSVKVRVDCSSTNGRRWRGYSTVHYVYVTLSEGKAQVTLGA